MFQPEKVIFVSPGQGSQKVGMGKEFYENAHTKELFELADDTLGMNLTKLMLEGDEKELSLTENTQPALLLTSYVAYTYLAKQTNRPLSDMASILAGHSLGEYASLAMADVFSLETALRLVQTRGRAMQDAVKNVEGAMAAIIGLTHTDVDSIARNTGCWIANDNSEGQVVISGTIKAIDNASNLAAMQDARKVVRLPVSAPFHCKLMQPAADVMAEALENVNMQEAVVPVICNVTAELTTDSSMLKQNLIEQVTGSVRWRESMMHAAEQGIEQVVELGTGKVLTGLAKRCDARLKGLALNSPQDVDTWLETLDKQKLAS